MKFKRSGKKFVDVCALALSVSLGVAVFYGQLNKAPVVHIPAYPQAPASNGFDLYLAAAKTIVPAKPAVDAVLEEIPPADEKARAKRYSLARKTVWLGANQKAFALFERAQNTITLSPSLRPPRTAAFLSTLRDIQRAKLVEIHAKRMRGDNNGALQSGLGAIQFGHDIRRGSSLICSLIGARWNDITRADMEGLAEKVDAPQAKRAARRMEKLLGSRWNLSDALVEDKYCYQVNWLEIFKQHDGWRYTLISTYNPHSARAIARSYLISKQNVVDETGVEFERQIANARLPYAQKGATTPPLDGLVFDDFVKYAVPLRYEDARDLAGDRLLMLQLALRAYRLERGQYPSDLKALTPNYLSAIPADPFGGGEALRYRKSGATYVLWSIGPDEIDDGGTPIPPNKDEKSRSVKRLPGTLIDSKGDFVAGKNRAIGFQWPRID